VNVMQVWVDGAALVMRCACGHEDAGQQRPATVVRALVLRMADHTRNCAETRDSEPILSENTTRTIDAR
jgi:hypothetical protein